MSIPVVGRSPDVRPSWPEGLSGALFPMLALLIGGIGLVLAQWAFLTQGGYSFTVGAPASLTYRVVAPMSYVDIAAARALRDMVGESVLGVAVRDFSAKARLARRLDAIRTMEDTARTAAALSLPEALLRAIRSLEERDRARLLDLTAEVGNAYIDRLKDEGVFMDGAAETGLLWEEIGKRSVGPEDANMIYQLLAKLGNLNLRMDPGLTESARRMATVDVPAVERQLELGDVIVARGEAITPQIGAILRSQGYTEDAFPTEDVCVVLAMVLLLPLWMDIIIGRERGMRRPSWWCVVFVTFVAWCCEALGIQLRIPGATLLPTALAAYLCIPGRSAFSVAFAAMSSGAFAIMGLGLSDFILLLEMGLIASVSGHYLLRRLESRAQLARRALALASILTVSRALLSWLQDIPVIHQFAGLSPAEAFGLGHCLYLLAELAAGHVLVMLLPAVEEGIGALTILRLRELSHPSSPLLRDLQRKAPGTYQHCITIATLAEAVAMELDMDVDLMRAGAYYHDIGKLAKPQSFVENQAGGTNVQDDRTPTASAIDIMSHVTRGLRMAEEAKLPGRIQDFIREHHGTTCLRYFYNKALASGEPVDRAAFCCPGPKPRSRETALLMIVDSTEAAVRSEDLGRKLMGPRGEEPAEDGELGHPNRGRGQAVLAVQELVARVVGSKMEEGQFDEADLTLRDISRIEEALCSVLLSMYHSRKVKEIRSPSPQGQEGGRPEDASPIAHAGATTS